MNKAWIHSEINLKRGGYYYSDRNKKPIIQHYLNDDLIIPAKILVATSIALLLLLPFVVLKVNRTAYPSYIIDAFPKLATTQSYQTREDFFERLSRKGKIEFEARVHYLEELIGNTRNKRINSKKIARVIVSESFRSGYDPFFVAAVIDAESSFRKDVRSNMGAIGLMQIQPATGRYVAKLSNNPWRGSSSLKDPGYNITLGISYLKYLSQRFEGNMDHVLIAYNWGPTNLANSITRKRKNRIPKSSKAYTKKILKNAKTWKSQFELLFPRYRDMATRRI